MNAFDAFVVVAATALVLLGLLRGLVRISLGILGIVFGLVVALRWEGSLAPRIASSVGNEVIAHLLAFALLLVGVMVGSVLLAWFLRHLLKKAHLGWLDRVLGGLTGLVCAALVAAAVAVPLTSVLPTGSRVLAESRLAPVTLQVSRVVSRMAPAELREKFRQGLDRMKEAAT